jgi:hypothetical protein
VDLDHDLDVDPHLAVDGDVEVDPIVDLDPRSAILDEDPTTVDPRSTCKVQDRVDVYVAVQRRGLGSTTRSTSTSSATVCGL